MYARVHELSTVMAMSILSGKIFMIAESTRCSQRYERPSIGYGTASEVHDRRRYPVAAAGVGCSREHHQVVRPPTTPRCIGARQRGQRASAWRDGITVRV